MADKTLGQINYEARWSGDLGWDQLEEWNQRAWQAAAEAVKAAVVPDERAAFLRGAIDTLTADNVQLRSALDQLIKAIPEAVECENCDQMTGVCAKDKVWADARAALSATPEQSMSRIQAEALMEIRRKISPQWGWCQIADFITDEALRLQAESGYYDLRSAELIAAAEEIERLRGALGSEELNTLLGMIEEGSSGPLWTWALLFMAVRDAALATPAESRAK